MARPSIADIDTLDGIRKKLPDDFDRELFEYFLDTDFSEYLLEIWFPDQVIERSHGIIQHIVRVISRLKQDYRAYNVSDLRRALHDSDYDYFPELLDTILIHDNKPRKRSEEADTVTTT